MNLTEFLTDRITETELAVQSDDPISDRFNLGIHIITVSAETRILATCQAHRRIIELHTGDVTWCGESPDDVGHDFARDKGWNDEEWGGAGIWSGPPGRIMECPTLRALATIYTNHPDYREQWKP